MTGRTSRTANSGAGRQPALAAAALCLLTAGTGALALDASPARAAAPADYQIPAGPVASALNHLADKTGAQLVYDAGLTRNVTTRGLKGRHTLDGALNELLAGTGLDYRLAPDGKAVAIMLAQAATATQSDAGAVPLPEVSAAAAEKANGNGAGKGVPVSPAAKAGYSAPAVKQSTTKISVPTFDLPISVQSVPEQVIQDQNAINIQDALQNVSGVRSNNNNVEAYVFNIRGFQSVNVLRDGLLISDAIPQNYDTANLQSIDVLKGPASFIFGRNDPGGVVNLVTKKPLECSYNSISQQAGSFNFIRTVWDLTGPVAVPILDSEALSYRFSGSYTKNGEFQNFVTNDKVFLAPAVTWRIAPATTLTVDGQYYSQGAVTFAGIPALTPFSRANPGYPASLPVYRSFQEPNEIGSTVNSAIIAYNLRHEFDGNWALTNRFLAARGTLDKTVLAGRGLAEPPILDRATIKN